MNTLAGYIFIALVLVVLFVGPQRLGRLGPLREFIPRAIRQTLIILAAGPRLVGGLLRDVLPAIAAVLFYFGSFGLLIAIFGYASLASVALFSALAVTGLLLCVACRPSHTSRRRA